MFDFWNRRSAESVAQPYRRAVRRPIVIGFEQLEGREMLSSGVALTISPTDTRPLLSMPRPYVSTFVPEAQMKVSIPRRLVSDDPESSVRSTRFRLLGGRFGRRP